MIARNCTRADLESALSLVNRYYSNNIRFKHLDPKGRGFSFTLTVNATSTGRGRSRVTAPGARLSAYHCSTGRQRRVSAACWHVHGHFFEALFRYAPSAVVRSSWTGGPCTITASEGNWQDANVGSRFSPMRFSEACECTSPRTISAAIEMEALS